MVERGVQIPVRPAGVIHGDLLLPDNARGLVVFAHGSGSSRGSPRNRQVADALRRRGLATLLFDLLTDAEEADDHRTGHNRFDIRLLAERLQHAVGFIGDDPDTAHLPVGLFGASTGAAGALVGAADQPERISAVVSAADGPTWPGPLAAVRAPTLLIVGGRDQVVLDLNREAATKLRCLHELVVVPGATHLFEEPGALDKVARVAGDWFTTHLGSGTT